MFYRSFVKLKKIQQGFGKYNNCFWLSAKKIATQIQHDLCLFKIQKQTIYEILKKSAIFSWKISLFNR